MERNRTSERHFFHAPLFPVALGMMSGILMDFHLDFGGSFLRAWLGLSLSTLLWSILFRKHKWVPSIGLLLISTGLGGILHCNAFSLVRDNHIVHFTDSEPVLCRVRGIVLTQPKTSAGRYAPFEKWQFSSESTSFLLNVRSVKCKKGFKSSSGLLKVRVRDQLLSIDQDDEVEVFGYLYRPRSPGNPGAFDWTTWQRRQGVSAGFSCSNSHCVQLRSRHAGTRSLLSSIRGTAGRLLHGRLESDRESGTLIEAMVLGKRSNLSDQVNDAFIRSGCAHFLAVSGLHVGLLALLVGILCKLAGFSLRSCSVIVFIVSLLYAILVEPRPPILRATIMIGVFCLALWIHRRPRPLNSLCLAGILILFSQPTALFSAGFQLSFIAVSGILFLTEPLMRIGSSILVVIGIQKKASFFITPLERTWKQTAARTVGIGLCVGLAAWLATLPVVMLHFGRFSPWGWLNSLLVSPVVLVTMIAGFLQLLVSSVLPSASETLAPILLWPSNVLEYWVDLLSRIPGVSMDVYAPNICWIVIYYILLATTALSQTKPGWLHRIIQRFHLSSRAHSNTLRVGNATGTLRIEALPSDCGSGILIYPPDGGVWLFDFGRPESSIQTYRLCNWLRYRNVQWIDMLILACPRLEQLQDYQILSQRVGIGAVAVSRWNRLPDYQAAGRLELIRRINSSGIPVVELDSGSEPQLFEGIKADVLWPPADGLAEDKTRTGAIAIRLTTRDARVLICGRLDDDAQTWLGTTVDCSAEYLFIPSASMVTQSTPRLIHECNATQVFCPCEHATAKGTELCHSKGVDASWNHIPESTVANLSLLGDQEIEYIPIPEYRRSARPEQLLTGALAVTLLGITLLPAILKGPRQELTMTVLDVGKGLSIVLELPTGETMLFDAGGSGSYDPGKGIILPFLRDKRIRQIDQITISHPNMDHYCGLPSLLSEIGCDTVQLNPAFPEIPLPNTPWHALLQSIPEIRKTITSRGDQFQYGDVTITTLWPPGTDMNGLESNDNSTVQRITYGNTSILLTGDIEIPAQKLLMESEDLQADILLAPHHGSTVSLSPDFLEAVSPDCIIIPTSARREQTIEAFSYASTGRRIHNTGEEGAIVVKVTPESWTSSGHRTE